MHFWIKFTCLMTLLTFSSVPIEASPLEFEQRISAVSLQDGTVLQARLWVPQHPKGPFPLVFILGGFRTASGVLELISKDLPQSFPTALVSFDYPFELPKKFRFPQSLAAAPEAKKTILNTIEGIQKTLKVLEAQSIPQLDFDRVVLIGASLGAPFTLIAAAQNPKLKYLVQVHGFARAKTTIAHQFSKKWTPRYGSWTKPFAKALAFAAWTYLGLEPIEEYAKRLTSNQSVLVIQAENDSRIPQESSRALLDSLRFSQANVQALTLPGDHVQPGKPKMIQNILDLTIEWIQSSPKSK